MERTTKKKSRWSNRIKSILVFLSLYLCGCRVLWAVPVTLKEVKDYVSGQERSFAHPLDPVLAGTISVLGKNEFTVERIERFNQKGLVQANWNETAVEIRLEAITPKMTRITTSIRSNRISREHSCEAAVFDEVQRILKNENPVSLQTATAGMVNVHASPNEDSAVIAYLRGGSGVQIVDEKGQWGEISLMNRNTGFVPLRHLHAAPGQSVQ